MDETTTAPERPKRARKAKAESPDSPDSIEFTTTEQIALAGQACAQLAKQRRAGTVTKREVLERLGATAKELRAIRGRVWAEL